MLYIFGRKQSDGDYSPCFGSISDEAISVWSISSSGLNKNQINYLLKKAFSRIETTNEDMKEIELCLKKFLCFLNGDEFHSTYTGVSEIKLITMIINSLFGVRMEYGRDHQIINKKTDTCIYVWGDELNLLFD